MALLMPSRVKTWAITTQYCRPPQLRRAESFEGHTVRRPPQLRRADNAQFSDVFQGDSEARPLQLKGDAFWDQLIVREGRPTQLSGDDTREYSPCDVAASGDRPAQQIAYIY